MKDIKIVGAAIRNTAIDQMCATLKSMGIPDADLAKAKAEALKTNSDKPLLALAKKNPIFKAFIP